MANPVSLSPELQQAVKELEKRDHSIPFAVELVNSRGNLSSLLFDSKGEICEKRREIVIELASKFNKPRLKEIVSDRETLAHLQYPIVVHPSMKQFGLPKKACLEALTAIDKRADLQFIPTKYLIDKIMEFLCTAVLKMDSALLKIEELKLTSLQEIFLYFVRLHDANYGEVYNKEQFVELLAELLPHSGFIEEVKRRFFFEERPGTGIVTAFFLLDGRYCSLRSFSAIQRALTLIALESGAPLQEQIASESCIHFLANYCKIHYKELSLEAILDNNRFQLPSFPEGGILSLCHTLGYKTKMELFEAPSPTHFLEKLNELVKIQGVEKLLFLGGPLFNVNEATLFGYPPAEFKNSFNRRVLKPAENYFIERLSLTGKELRKLLDRDNLPQSISGTAFEIAVKLCQKNDDILKMLNHIEIHFKRPQTIGIARYGDGSYLVCHMDFKKGCPLLCRLSSSAIKAVDFNHFKLAQVLIQEYPYFEKMEITKEG